MMFILAAALAVATPAEPAAAPIPPSDKAPVALKATSIKPSEDFRRVCVVDTITGSRIPRKFCQTRAEWIAEGVDPLAAR